MISILTKKVVKLAYLVCGYGFLTIISLSASATEYRLFVNDTAACRNAGVTGSVCLVQLGASTASSTSTSATSASTSSGSTSSGGSDCVITSWNPCSTGSSGNTGSSSSSSVSSSSVSSSSVSSSSAPSAASSPVPQGSVAAGNLDFGSGGGNATGNTYPVTFTSSITAYPFTVKPGRFFGAAAIVVTSTPFPSDGTGVRMWWSKTSGGSPISSGCAANMGRTATFYWDQTGTLGYGCSIPNEAATLYLNFRTCIAPQSDATCSSSDAKAGSPAPVYVSGLKGTR